MSEMATQKPTNKNFGEWNEETMEALMKIIELARINGFDDIFDEAVSYIPDPCYSTYTGYRIRNWDCENSWDLFKLLNDYSGDYDLYNITMQMIPCASEYEKYVNKSGKFDVEDESGDEITETHECEVISVDIEGYALVFTDQHRYEVIHVSDLYEVPA